MADQLIQIVSFANVAPGATVALPHNLNVSGRALIPDYIAPSTNGFTINANAATVTVTNNNPGATSIDVWCEFKHTIQRAFNGVQNTALVPQPFKASGGASSSAAVIQELQLTPPMIPVALGASVNGYSPVDAVNPLINFSNTSLIYQATLTAGSTITGFDSTVVDDGDVRIIRNNGDGLGAGDLTLVHESGSSAAADRMRLPGFKNFTLAPGGTAILCYSIALGRWTIWSEGEAFVKLYTRNLNLNGEITPAPLAAGVTQDWAPVDAVNPNLTFQNSAAVRVVVPTGGASLGGLDSTNIEIGDVRILVNHGDGSGSIGVSDLTLIERDLGSLIANRFVLPNLSTLVIPYTGAIMFRYDAPASGWIPIALSVGGRIRRINGGALAFVSQGVVLAAGDNPNFNPLDGLGNPLLDYTTYFRLTPDAGGSSISGVVLQSDGSVLKTGQVLIFENAVGNVPITFLNASGLSTAGNRFAFPNGDFVLPPKASLALIYDFVAAAWVPITNITAFSKVTMFGRIDDLALGAAVNDYNPTGFGRTGRLRLASAAATNISGMVAQEDGAVRTLTAYGAGITLLHQSALSAAPNRYFLPNLANYAIPSGGSADCFYDAAFGGWLLKAKAS